MDDGRLCFLSKDFRVEVIEPAACGIREVQHRGGFQRPLNEEVVEGTKLAELGDKPELNLVADVSVVRCDEAEDVRVTEEAGFVDVDFVRPRFLVHRVEDLDGNFVALVQPLPHLAVPSLPDKLVQGNLPGDRQHGKQWLSSAASRVVRIVEALLPARAGVSTGDGGHPTAGAAARPQVVMQAQDDDNHDHHQDEQDGENRNGDHRVQRWSDIGYRIGVRGYDSHCCWCFCCSPRCCCCGFLCRG